MPDKGPGSRGGGKKPKGGKAAKKKGAATGKEAVADKGGAVGKKWRRFPQMFTARGCLMVEDPVCSKRVDPEQASCKSEYRGQTYYFCSLQCKQLFDAEPREYIVS
jgi:YHS domain-containing protein